ncbi:MAG TPA: hypothetical protein VK272_01130 [Solirubrobacteraceae bacterium]|nr:hypothetical protein [Solirubrobacteraceae bacterium]
MAAPLAPITASRRSRVTKPGALVSALALLAGVVCAYPPATAAATSETATLHAAFRPDRLGASTTISFGFHIATSEGLAPPPLTNVDLRMPAGINYASTTLGLAVCQPSVLLADGLAGCSPNARLGFGSAYVEVPFGSGSGHEIPEIQALMGPPHNGNLVVLFYANGQTPVDAQLVFSGEVLPAYGSYGSQLAAVVPPIASVPGGPDVSVISLKSTIGPSQLTYYRHSHGRRVPFHPVGVSVPERCPRGGFPFSAEFQFQDGSRTSASTSVPCPPHRQRG